MISAWHLLWIIPLSGLAGVFVTVLIYINPREDEN